MLNTTFLTSSAELAAPVLTAYLDTASVESHGLQNKRGYLPWLRKQAKSLVENVRPNERGLFEQQLERLESFLRDHTPQGKGLVVFVGPETWELAPLQQRVENELHWGRPALTQLEWSLREAKPVCVAVADRTGARFFRYALGELALLAEKKFEIDISQWKKKELGHVTGQDVRKTRGSQRDTHRHRMEAQIQRLLRETSKLAQDLCEKQKLIALFLVCSERLLKPIEDGFSKDFRQRVITIREDLHGLAVPELQDFLEPHFTNWKRKYEAAQVDSLLAEERKAVVGLDETLAQLQKGKIRSILLAHNLNMSLRQCTECGWTDSSADTACPVCKRKERYPVDLRHVLPELARNGAAGLQVVGDKAAAKLMRAGGIGGWLRNRTRAELR
jgi:rubrerythrin